MKFFPFAFTGTTMTADLYYDVDNIESYTSGSTTWYNIGKTDTKVSYTNLNVSSSWYATDSTGSYIAAPAGVDIKFNGGISNVPVLKNIIYEIDLNTSVNGERFLGRDGITINRYWCAINSDKYARFRTTGYSMSTLSVSPTMQNGFFYVSIKCTPLGGAGSGDTVYSTSLDGFQTDYIPNDPSANGIATFLDYLDFIITGMGKLRTIAVFYNRNLTAAQLLDYTQNGPYK